jgi:hypothetical protein
VDASNDGSIITGTGRQDLLYSWDASNSVPTCSESFPVGSEGNLAVTPDVGGQFAGSATPQGGESTTQGHTDVCAPLFQSDLVGQVQGGRYAAQGDWIGVNSRTFIHVYDSQTGALRASVPIPGETQAAVGISGDGSILAVGGFSRTIRVYQWDNSQYVELWNHSIPSITWITAVDVSDDGSTVMVGTWANTAPNLGRAVLYDVATGPTPLWTSSEFGDFVASVALSADGSRAIAGSWGRFQGTFGHVVAAYDRASATPFFTVGDDEIPGVGSAFAVDISNDGMLACAGGKAVHARDFGNGGYAMSIDLGGTTPVDLLSFNGQSRADCGVELDWATGFESDHAGFHVSRTEMSGELAGESIRLTSDEMVLPESEVGGRRTYRFVDSSSECDQSYVYHLDAVDRGGREERLASLTIAAAPVSVAATPRLLVGQNRPNPFRASLTEIPFELGERSRVQIGIFDASGRAVRVLDLGEPGAGAHVATWDGLDGTGIRVPSGSYFYRVEAGVVSATRRLVILN